MRIANLLFGNYNRTLLQKCETLQPRICQMTSFFQTEFSITNIANSLKITTIFRQIGKKWLQTLEEQHWNTGNLTVDLNACFGTSLLFAWPYDIVQTITFLTTLTDFPNSKNSGIAIVNLMERFVRIMIFLLIIIYLGRTGTQLTNQVI